MKDYCCQIISVSGRVLETFYEDMSEAINKCDTALKTGHAVRAQVFKYPDMDNPIYPVK